MLLIIIISIIGFIAGFISYNSERGFFTSKSFLEGLKAMLICFVLTVMVTGFITLIVVIGIDHSVDSFDEDPYTSSNYILLEQEEQQLVIVKQEYQGDRLKNFYTYSFKDAHGRILTKTIEENVLKGRAQHFFFIESEDIPHLTISTYRCFNLLTLLFLWKPIEDTYYDFYLPSNAIPVLPN